MPRKMTKNAEIVPLSLGKATHLRGIELHDSFRPFIRKTQNRSASKSELFELALNLGFSILEPIAEAGNWMELEAVKKRVARISKRESPKARTLAEITDDDLKRLEAGENLE